MGTLWVPGIPIDALPYVGGVFTPAALVEHRTIGRWPGDYSVLSRGRVPSVHFLVGQDEGQWVQFYPMNRTCAHAAGANSYALGIEFSGQNGEPLTEWQLLAGAKIHTAVINDLGIPAKFLDVDEGRVAYYHGFLNHANVATTPQYTHYDYITRPEFERMAFGFLHEQVDMRGTFVRDTKTGWVYVQYAGVLYPVRSERHGAVIKILDPLGYTNDYLTAESLAHSDIKQFSLYADHQPVGWPSPATADWTP